MAVGADRAKVYFGIHLIGCADGSEWYEVMYVNKACSHGTVAFTEVHVADVAPIAMPSDAAAPCASIALIRVDCNPPHGAFKELPSA